jgi:hypothetical protein
MNNGVYPVRPNMPQSDRMCALQNSYLFFLIAKNLQHRFTTGYSFAENFCPDQLWTL